MPGTSATRENYCARWLGVQEGEEILAVSEEVARHLNPRYEEDRLAGRAASLPDSLSRKGNAYRLREVKYKLEERIVRKALAQLSSGTALLAGKVDRLEIVVPLGERRLKSTEAVFLGEPLGACRYMLLLDGKAVRVEGTPVTVVVLGSIESRASGTRA